MRIIRKKGYKHVYMFYCRRLVKAFYQEFRHPILVTFKKDENLLHLDEKLAPCMSSTKRGIRLSKMHKKSKSDKPFRSKKIWEKIDQEKVELAVLNGPYIFYRNLAPTDPVKARIYA